MGILAFVGVIALSLVASGASARNFGSGRR